MDCVFDFNHFLSHSFVQFPEMVGYIHGEESNKFENGLGNYLIEFKPMT